LWKWGHPLKGPCQEGKPILGEKIYFLAEPQYPVTAISTIAEISFRFRLQPLLHQSPIRIKVRANELCVDRTNGSYP
jgi:hypothetical protein